MVSSASFINSWMSVVMFPLPNLLHRYLYCSSALTIICQTNGISAPTPSQLRSIVTISISSLMYFILSMYSLYLPPLVNFTLKHFSPEVMSTSNELMIAPLFSVLYLSIFVICQYCSCLCYVLCMHIMTSTLSKSCYSFFFFFSSVRQSGTQLLIKN
jgi:hypothetical protein